MTTKGARMLAACRTAAQRKYLRMYLADIGTRTEEEVRALIDEMTKLQHTMSAAEWDEIVAIVNPRREEA